MYVQNFSGVTQEFNKGQDVCGGRPFAEHLSRAAIV